MTSGPPGWNSLNPEGRREVFVALWRQMHDDFTRVKGLRNLIWVYSTEGSANHQFEKNPDASQWKSPLHYYPGDDVVDVVGVDWYGWAGDQNAIPGWAALAALGKPVALTEFGSEAPAVNYNRLLEDIRKHNPGLAYFLAWDEGWSLAAHPGSDDLLRAPWVESLPAPRWEGLLMALRSNPIGAASRSPGQAPAPPWVMGKMSFCPVGAASQILDQARPGELV